MCSNFFRTLRPEQGTDAKFLAWKLQHLYQHPSIWRFQQQTTGIINLKHRDYLDQSVLVPPLPEQQLIASILDTVDEVIRKTEEVIAKLQQMKQGLLHDLLTRGIDDNGELRDPDRHPEQFKDSELGRIPKDWEVEPLGEATEDIRYGTSAHCEQAGTHLVLRIPNIRHPRLVLEDRKFYSPSAAEAKRYALQGGDLLVIRTNGNPKLLGRCGLVGPEAEHALFASYLIRIRLDGRRLRPAFGALFLNRSEMVRAWVERRAATSAGNYNINTTQLRACPFGFPSLGEQEAIVGLHDSLQNRLEKEQAELQKLRLLKSGLMDDLLTGRVRVTDLLPTTTP